MTATMATQLLKRYLNNNSFVSMVTVYKQLYLNVNNVQRQLLESVEVLMKT